MNHVDIADPGMRFVAELEVLGQTVREMADPGHYSFEYRDRAKPWQLKLATLRRIYRDARRTLRHDDDPAYSRLDAYVSQVFDPDSRMLGMQSVDAWITETIEALAPSAADGYDDYQVIPCRFCGADIDHDGHRPACPVLATLCPQCGSPVTDTHPDADGCAIAHAEAVLA
jgi:hypothetical protein